MENLPEKISPIKGATLPKTHRLITEAELSTTETEAFVANR
jgi:hypothetical protein